MDDSSAVAEDNALQNLVSVALQRRRGEEGMREEEVRDTPQTFSSTGSIGTPEGSVSRNFLRSICMNSNTR